jgi:hypothetical protein
MLTPFGQRIVEAMFEAGINSYSELLDCLLDAGARPEEANANTLIIAIMALRVVDRPDFSSEFWRVLASPRVLDLRKETKQALMLTYASEGHRAIY